MMQTMNIVMPDALSEFVQQQVARLGYENVGDYVCELVQADMLRKEKLTLEAEVLRGLECKERIVMTDEVWAAMRQEVQDRLVAKSANQPSSISVAGKNGYAKSTSFPPHFAGKTTSVAMNVPQKEPTSFTSFV